MLGSRVRAPEGVQKRESKGSRFFVLCRVMWGENPGVSSLLGRSGECKYSSTRLPAASSAVEPLRGYRSENRKVLAFFVLCRVMWGENPGVSSLSGRSGGCKYPSTRLPAASSAVEPLRGDANKKSDGLPSDFLFYVAASARTIGYFLIGEYMWLAVAAIRFPIR